MTSMFDKARRSILFGAGTMVGLLGRFSKASAMQVADIPSAPQAISTSESDSAAIGFIQSGKDSIKRSMQEKLREQVSVKDFGASGDWAPGKRGAGTGTDDTRAFIAAAASARATGRGLRIPGGKYRVTASLDFSGLSVTGDGTEQSVIYASNNEFDVITTTGRTFLKDFGIDGGWDGVKSGLSGHALRLSAPSGKYPYNVHCDNLRIQNAKADGILVERGGYSSFNRVKINACGLHAIELKGTGPANYATTISIGEMSTLSDTPNGYGLMLTNAQNISATGVISEYTRGIHLAGRDNRAISLRSYYQEHTIGGQFLTSDGAGIGLTIQGCFGGGNSVSELPAWENVYFQGNSNLVECAASANSGRTQLVIGPEITHPTEFNGDFTACSLTLKPGAWHVFASLQTHSNGGSDDNKMTKVSFQVAADQKAPGFAPFTDNSYSECADMRIYDVPTNSPTRLSSDFVFKNNGSRPITLYLRGYLACSAGKFTTKSSLRAIKF